MKVVFISNFYNHHQAPFSEAVYKITNGNYTFIETEEMNEERKALGYGIDKPGFVIMRTDENAPELQRTIDEADAVIIGSANQKLIKNRIKQKKLIFEYSERIYKTKPTFLKRIRNIIGRFLRNKRYKNTYMLCASAYTAADYAKLFAYKNKTYKFGYFPAVKEYDDIRQMICKKKKASILWAGRLIDWKHTDASIRVAEKLKKDGYDFSLNIIGNGELEQYLKDFVAEKGLTDCVNFLGSMKPNEVRKHMEQSQIYLFTSDFNEGWGAVLNEAMNSGCAVVASHAIGAVPFLINDGNNGLIYENGKEEQLYNKVKYLLDRPEKCAEYGTNAYFSIVDCCNAKVVAQRFIQLAQAIINGEKAPDLFDFGALSKAEIIENNWYSE